MVIEIIEMLEMLIVGLICVILGLQLCKKQKISIVPNYLHGNVEQQDVKDYTRLIGIGLLIIGISTGFTGLIDYFFEIGMCYIIFVLGYIVGFVFMNKAQRKYNR